MIFSLNLMFAGLALLPAASPPPSPQADLSAPETDAVAPDGSDWVAVPGPHIDFQTFITTGSLLGSRELYLQQRGLDQVEGAIRNGGTSPDDPNVLSLIARASLEFSTVRIAPGQAAPPNYPDIRARGLRLLALLGGEGSHELILRVIEVEPDPSVLSEAWASLRKTHAPLETALVPSLVRQLRDPFPNGPNDGLIQEILRFIQEGQGNGNVASRELFDAILGVYQNRRYLQQTNDLALKTLKKLMGMT